MTIPSWSLVIPFNHFNTKKMKNLLLTTFLLLITLFANAQTETTNWLYNLEGKTPETPKIENQNNAITLKILNTERHFDEDFILGRTIEQAINNGELTIYQDRKCTKPYSKEAAKNAILSVSVDTIITFDAETFAEEIKIIRKEIPFFPNERTVYELEQSWEYDNKTNGVNMRINAVHVSVLGVNANGEVLDFTYRKPIFSIKNEDLKKINFLKDLEKPSVIWAKEFSYNADFQNAELRAKLLSKKHLNAHKIVAGYDRKSILTPDEFKQLSETGILIDTVVTFDPETFEETIAIIKTEVNFDAEHITSFRVIQNFYFDTQTNSFQTRILAVAPLRKAFDEQGNFKYQFPIFWIVYEDDFIE